MRRGIVRLFVLLGSVLGLMSAEARAATLYSQGQVVPDQAGNSDTDAPTPELFADDFVIPSGGTIDSVSWEGLYNPSFTGGGSFSGPAAFTIRFYADGGTAPTGAPLSSSFVGDVAGVLTGEIVYTGDVERYEATLTSNFVAAPGVKYWFSVQNDTSADANDSWLWSGIQGGGTGDPIRWSHDAGATWPFTYGMDMTFELYGEAVPEPTAAMLMLTGMGLLMCRRRRRNGLAG